MLALQLRAWSARASSLCPCLKGMWYRVGWGIFLDVLGGSPGMPFPGCTWVRCVQSADGSGGTLLLPWTVGPHGAPGQSDLTTQGLQSQSRAAWGWHHWFWASTPVALWQAPSEPALGQLVWNCTGGANTLPLSQQWHRRIGSGSTQGPDRV